MKRYCLLKYLSVAILCLNTACDNRQQPIHIEDRTKLRLVDSLRDYGANLLDVDSINSAISVLERALNLNPSEETKAEILSNIGYGYAENQEFAKALKSYLKAIEGFRRLNLPFRVAQVEANTASTLEYMGGHDLAMQFATRAFSVFENDTSFKVELAFTLTVLGDLSNSIGNYKGAMKHHKKALEMRIEQKDIFGIAVCENNIGLVYLNRGLHDSALNYFINFLNISREIRDENAIAKAYRNIAKTYVRGGNLIRAKPYIDSAFDLYSRLHNKIGLADVHILNAEYFINKDSVIEEAKIALSICDSVKLSEEKLEAYNILASAYTEKEQFQKALEYRNMHSRFKDSILGKEKISRIFAIELTYQADKNKQILDNIEHSKIQKTWQRNIALLVVVFLFVITIVLFRRFKEKKNFSNILLNKNDLLQRQNQSLLDIRDKLIEQNSNMSDKVSSMVADAAVYFFDTIGPIEYKNIVMLDKSTNPSYKNDVQVWFFDTNKNKVVSKMEFDKSLKYFNSDPDGMLPENLFAQVAQHCIVNLRRLRKDSSLNKWEYYLDDYSDADKPTVIVISRTYQVEFERRFAEYKKIFGSD